MGKIINGNSLNVEKYHYNEYLRLLENNDYLKALKELKEFDRISNAKHYDLFAELFFEIKNYGRAMEYWSLYLFYDTEPSYARFLNGLGACLYRLENYKEALNCFSIQLDYSEGKEFKYDYLIEKCYEAADDEMDDIEELFSAYDEEDEEDEEEEEFDVAQKYEIKRKSDKIISVSHEEDDDEVESVRIYLNQILLNIDDERKVCELVQKIDDLIGMKAVLDFFGALTEEDEDKAIKLIDILCKNYMDNVNVISDYVNYYKFINRKGEYFDSILEKLRENTITDVNECAFCMGIADMLEDDKLVLKFSNRILNSDHYSEHALFNKGTALVNLGRGKEGLKYLEWAALIADSFRYVYQLKMARRIVSLSNNNKRLDYWAQTFFTKQEIVKDEAIKYIDKAINEEEITLEEAESFYQLAREVAIYFQDDEFFSTLFSVGEVLCSSFDSISIMEIRKILINPIVGDHIKGEIISKLFRFGIEGIYLTIGDNKVSFIQLKNPKLKKGPLRGAYMDAMASVYKNLFFAPFDCDTFYRVFKELHTFAEKNDIHVKDPEKIGILGMYAYYYAVYKDGKSFVECTKSDKVITRIKNQFIKKGFDFEKLRKWRTKNPLDVESFGEEYFSEE